MFIIRSPVFLLLWLTNYFWPADDPDIPHVQHHRSFLNEHVVFKEVAIIPYLFSFLVLVLAYLMFFGFGLVVARRMF